MSISTLEQPSATQVDGSAAYSVAVFPLQWSDACRLDQLQRKMVSGAMVNTRSRTEDWATFCRRSAKQCSEYIERHSVWWSRKWLQRAISGDARLIRDFGVRCQLCIGGGPLVDVQTKRSRAPILHVFHNRK